MSAKSLFRNWSVLSALLICCILSAPSSAHTSPKQFSINIQVPPSLSKDPIVSNAADDTVSLLSRAFPSARILQNSGHADVILRLPDIVTHSTAKAPDSSQLSEPDRSYIWQSSQHGSSTVLKLVASTPEGISCGIYHLLQEQLKIRFLHPCQTIIPRYQRWPLPVSTRFSGHPIFAHQGFHLHTLHPIELTEQLHDPARHRAFEDVARYLDWLARNNQNTFQFFLLRGIDRDTWIPHARRIIRYAHNRGIRCGIEISLSMLQQQAFQTITLLRPYPSYQKQVDNTLAWLFQAPWDFISLEPMLGEHLPLISRLLPDAQAHFEETVVQTYRRPLFLATHVIRHEGGKEAVRRPINPKSGILIHTVMCYSASEDMAPVYGNENQKFMLQAATEEHHRRETWYWPESSYWVGFDISVPLLLLPYLDSRWDDILTMRRLGLPGYLTFSSGWEWGYWLIDWSIARWGWCLTKDGMPIATTPLTRLFDLLPDPQMMHYWKQSLNLQNRFLKQKELLSYMAAATPFSELPPPFDLPFQPTPHFRYPWLLNTASVIEVNQILQGPVANLNRYAAEMYAISGLMTQRLLQLKRADRVSNELYSLIDELITGLHVTALRASHRALTLQAMATRHRAQLGGIVESDRFLTKAVSIRLQAQALVTMQEGRYRYPTGLLARPRASLTAYPFGYLYPASRLYFWQREESQVRNERFDPFFMNIRDIRRILGFESLLLR